MEYKTLSAKKHVDEECGFRLRHVKSETERFRPHDHDYYELFLVLRGSAEHAVNGERIPVGAGDLIFIRDFDIHDYAGYEKGGIEFLNLAFTRENLRAVLDFLEYDEKEESLLSPSTPPMLHLSVRDSQSLHLKLASLLSEDSESPCRKRARMRRLLAEIISEHLFRLGKSDEDIPRWLFSAYERMRTPKNFLAGTERLFELCGRSREHVTRLLSHHYGQTPTEYVCELKLGYAAGLLRNSNLSVSEVSFESGFNNLSHFYQRFEKKFGCTPREYRCK